MLNDATKRKINNCRDTLVGKIPVPMSQIEQITLAMTYKFMSDIDAENSALGGTSFFEGEYAKYAWKNLMDKRNGAQERLNLYSEGLDSMSRNPHIPELFRDIFRNAYLPFKDPTTLDRFLKQIDEFHYGHSEELGNAFEYLLSTAGSQGDAGQFRTPRHIIDFLVAVVDPSQSDTILDPACGTAGFLISAYKHIIEQGGSSLSIDEKQNITKNIVGYDISHDMVRLSLVNMYLHHFADPRIYEYDTLSMETRWNEEYSCILANPPFMTPKGGIEPHKRFSIRATKSEVLFVDYIMEHLSIHGKAGIIVPEGVIFQSGNAYKDLRKKMIMDNYLYAVVSLPSGIFQPYSGVKTSILFFDRKIAKKTDKILFVKVANDGYDLGAQRRKIAKNDLPEAFEILKQYKEVGIELPLDKGGWGDLAHLVEKSKIAESGDYNLSGDRYRVSTNIANSEFEMVELGEVCEIQNGYAFDAKLFDDNDATGFPLIRIRNIKTNNTKTKYTGIYTEEFIVKNGDLLIGMDGEFNSTIWNGGDALLNQRVCRLRSFNGVLKKYVSFIIGKKLQEIEDSTVAITVKHISSKQILGIKIPLPPLEIQEHIVAELDGYQRIIDGARQVVQNYKPTIKIDPEWEIVELGNTDIFKIESGGTPDSKNEAYWNGDILWATLVDLPQENYITTITSTVRKITIDGLKNSSAKLVPPGSIIVSSRATIGRVAINDLPIATNQGFKNIILQDVSRALPKFVALMAVELKEKMESLASGGTFAEISKTNFCTLQIPLPSLEIQEQIVARIESEQRLVDATKELIAIYEGKVKERIGEVWGEI